jgi:hypothetical protein
VFIVLFLGCPILDLWDNSNKASLVIFSFKDFFKGYGHIQAWGMMEISSRGDRDDERRRTSNGFIYIFSFFE